MPSSLFQCCKHSWSLKIGLAALFCIITWFALSHQAAVFVQHWVRPWISDVWLHLFAFSMLTLVSRFVLADWHLLKRLLLLAGYGLWLETLQYLIESRHVSALDYTINLTSIVMTECAIALFLQIKKKVKKTAD